MTAHDLVTKLFGPHLPMVYQSEAAECGMACLVMIASYYGKPINMSTVRQDFSISLRGLDLNGLISLAQSLELQTRPVSLQLTELDNLRLPAILHWNMEHYVVLKSVHRKTATIHDPALGKRTVKLCELSHSFTGVALEVQPQLVFEGGAIEKINHWKTFRKLVPNLKVILAKLFILSVILQGLVMLLPLYMQTVIDQVLASHNDSLLVTLALGFAVILLLEILVSGARSLLVIRFSTHLNLQISANLFHHLMTLPASWYEKRHKADIISRFGSLEPIQQFYTVTLIEAILDIILVLVALLVMLQYDLFLTAVVISVLLLNGLIKILSVGPFRELQEQNIQLKAKESSHFIESIHAFQTIKLANHSNQRENQWLSNLVDTLNTKIRLSYFQLWLQISQKFLFGVENILIIYLGAHLVMTQTLSVGMLIAFISYKSQFVAKSNRLIDIVTQFRMLTLHNDRLSDITAAQSEEKSYAIRMLDNTSIELDRVWFRYSEHDEWIIQDFSCRIQSGEFVALTGPSGIGKSTLLKLITSMLKPTSGRIVLGGVDISHLSVQQLRSHMAVVLQEDHCFTGTIAQNISLFDQTPDFARIKQAAELADLNKVIESMPMAYNSLIGDMGTNLSGGQKQRLLIARALYQQPAILILDEASAHLDSATEQRVNQHLRKLDITRIVIAHRQSTIDASDRVIELNSQAKKSPCKDMGKYHNVTGFITESVFGGINKN